VDTVSIPDGQQVWLTIPMNEGAQVSGPFVMHCHILEHEDGGMMANVVAGYVPPSVPYYTERKSVPHLPPLEVATVKLPQPAAMVDAHGKQVTSELFRQNELSLVTFGFTTCQGACPLTLEKCVAALQKLPPAEAERISPFFVSLDVERDDPQKLRDYSRAHHLSPIWRTLLDTNLTALRGFGAQRLVLHRRNGSIYLRHSTAIYLVDRSLKIRAAFDDEDTAEEISTRMAKELESSGTVPAGRRIGG
jgi:protein SCO1/2